MKTLGKDAEDPMELYDLLIDYFPNKIEDLFEDKEDAKE